MHLAYVHPKKNIELSIFPVIWHMYILKKHIELSIFPVKMLKYFVINSGKSFNNRLMQSICSKLTLKTVKQHYLMPLLSLCY